MIVNGQHLEHGIYGPSPPCNLDKFKEAICGKKFLDLGSGRGEIVEKALELGADAYGVEINAELFSESKAKDRIIFGNILDQEFSKYDILYYYIGGCKRETELWRKITVEFKGNVILFAG